MNSDQKQIIEISSGTLFRFVLIVLAIYFLYLVRSVVEIFLFALIISSGVQPFVSWLDRRGLPRLLGVLILYLGVFALLVTLITLLVPFAAQEIGQLSENLPALLAKISASLENVQESTQRYFDIVGQLQHLLDNLNQFLQESSQSAFGFLFNIFGGVFAFFAIIILSFYLSVLKRGIESFLAAAVPNRYENYVIDLWRRTQYKLGRWLQGQFLLTLIVGLMTYIGLSLFGIKFALVLAIIAMILELVPTVGPVLAAVPAVILAFLQSPETLLGLWVIILYVIVQQIENQILVPIIMGRVVGLNPVIVILSLLVGAKLGGITGLILAVPVATILVEIFNDIVDRRKTPQTQTL